MVKINAGSVHRAINNLGFFTTLAHLYKNAADCRMKISVSGLQKAATYTMQQPFLALPFLSGWHMKFSWKLPYQHEPV